jgi:hypothetical protein
MPRIKLTKSAIDALPTPSSDVVYWDAAYPGFGVKVTPKGRKVFIVLYRTGGAGSHLRKYTIGTYGRVTLHQARVAAQKVFATKADGRDPAAEKREPSAELWQIGSMICLRTSLPSGFQRTARSPRSPGSDNNAPGIYNVILPPQPPSLSPRGRAEGHLARQNFSQAASTTRESAHAVASGRATPMRASTSSRLSRRTSAAITAPLAPRHG